MRSSADKMKSSGRNISTENIWRNSRESSLKKGSSKKNIKNGYIRGEKTLHSSITSMGKENKMSNPFLKKKKLDNLRKLSKPR